MHADGMFETVSTSVAVNGREGVNRVGLWGDQEGVCHPGSPGCRLAEQQGVGCRINATVDRTFNAGRGGREEERDFFLYRILAYAPCEAGDESNRVRARLRIGRSGVVTVADNAIAEIPQCSFYSFSTANCRDAVHCDGATVVERNVEEAVVNSYHTIEQTQRESGSGKGTHRELAGGIVDKGKVAKVSDVVVRLNTDALSGAVGRSILVRVPTVVESRRGGEGVVGNVAAPLRRHALAHTVEGEVCISVVRPLVAVVGGQPYVHRLPRIGTHVEAHGSPVFPQHVVFGGIPPQCLIGNKVGGTAVRVYQVHC